MTRARIIFVLGAVMIGLGIFIALRPLIFPQMRVTGSIALDMAFAFFFALRGWFNVRTATRALRATDTKLGAGNP